MRRFNCLFVMPLLLAQAGWIWAEPVAVRFKEGSVHGYLELRSEQNKVVAAGDLIQTVHGERVTSRLTFHYRDGSLDDETAVFTQRGHFKLLTDHHIQKGPSYKDATDVSFDTSTGRVIDRYSEKGKTKVDREQMDLPPDLANGLMLTALKNIRTDVKEWKVSYLVTTPKPRVINFSITPNGSASFSVAGLRHKATLLLVKAELGGIEGMIAPLIGKEPPDTKVWIAGDEVPAFVRSEGSLCLGCPILTIELTSPVWH